MGLFIVAAAATYSKDGGGAGLPMGLLGVAFAAGYRGSRKASVLFLIDNEILETPTGSRAQAEELVKAVLAALDAPAPTSETKFFTASAR
jgi:hypothetical protein